MAPLGLYVKIVNVGGSILPLFTVNKPFIFKDSIFFLLKTSTSKPASSPSFSISDDSFSAFKKETGSLTKSFVLKTESINMLSSEICSSSINVDCK